MTSIALRLRGSRHLPVVAGAACIVALLLVGSVYSRNFLSPEYLLLQLQIASFLGIVATGAMLVILLGGIDLSVPWVVTVGGMMSTAAAGWWPGEGAVFAIPFGIFFSFMILLGWFWSNSLEHRPPYTPERDNPTYRDDPSEVAP